MSAAISRNSAGKRCEWFEGWHFERRMKRKRERVLVAVGSVRICVFCFDSKPIVALERAPNGDPEFVCGDCHHELQRDIAASSVGRLQR